MLADQSMTLGLAQLGDLEEPGIDVDLATPAQSPVSLTSSLLALSPISAGDLDPTSPLDFDADTRAASPPSPLSIKIQPLPSYCISCGSSVITHPPSTVALYSLAVNMAPATRGSRANPLISPPVPPAVKHSRGRKRKSPAADLDEDATISAPDPAPNPSESAPAPVPTAPTTNTKAKAKSKATPTTASTKGKSKAPPTIGDTSTGPMATRADDLDEHVSVPAQPGDTRDLDQPAAPPVQPTVATTPQGSVTDVGEALDTRPPPTRAEVEALEKELRTLKKFKVMYFKSQQSASVGAGAASTGEGSSSSLASQVPDDSVPRPPGERGKNGWNMQTALRLEDDGDMYNAILGATRDAVRQAGLDWRLKFEEQDPSRVGACYNQMKNVYPYLKRFKSNWACRELVMGVLQNRRKSEHAKLKGTGAKKVERTAKRAGFKPRPKTTDDSDSGAATISSTSATGNQAEAEN